MSDHAPDAAAGPAGVATDPARIVIDPDLPIAAAADDIAAALTDHQVVIVAGETGSGKTTQLPKICLRLGRERIAHTQPRRIAARSVAERVAAELQVSLGSTVGYQVRFTRRATAETKIKIMTDGVLLNEINHDRELRRYDTIIVDEAHERSLNIDFLLGYLKQLLPRRPDLKVIVTSATIDTERFAAHFAAAGRPAPIIEVSGRTYPVEIRYRPLVDGGSAGPSDEPADEDRRPGRARAAEQRDQVDAIVDATAELMATGPGDILVFLAGEREIRDAQDALSEVLDREVRTGLIEIVPLYARLSAAEQHKVFAAHAGRRIVLSTNVAETSLTVPGIRFVIDSGTARISRYSARTKVQRLPIEPISRASADQRAGRCGRLGPGVCIRLFSRDDFEARPAFTEPEILRTNLASVILQMAAARLGEIATFPFVEPPDAAPIGDGLRLLTELGAIVGGPGRRGHAASGRAARRHGGGSVRLTGVGRRLARIPLDPRMGRMLLEADRQGCLREALIIVAGMSIQDPRERPADQAEKADRLHRRFWAPLPAVPDATDGAAEAATDEKVPEPDGSDFLAYLRLWDYLRARRRELSGNAFRRMCRDEFLHFLRIREWQDLHTQLREVVADLGLVPNTVSASAAAIHTAILSGLLSNVGLADLREDRPAPRSRSGARRRPIREYLGARGTRFAINPGSSVARSQPELVMAGEIVETSRLWARTVAGIQAEWVEQVGEHLLVRHYADPHWSARAGSVVATERVTLLGVPIIAGRQVGYGKINPAEARAIFIQSALVEGDWRTRHRFFEHNQRVREEAADLEVRSRRRGLLVDDAAIAAFYDRRIPADVVSAAHFDSWWDRQRQDTPDLLDLTLEDLLTGTDEPDRADFPDRWTLPALAGQDVTVDVDYVFSPGDPHDGVTVRIPVELVNRVDPAGLTWQVPGLRTELATELIRSLPKRLRTSFVPAPDHARDALAWLAEHPANGSETLGQGLGRALLARTGVAVPDDAWDPDHVPDRLRVRLVVIDGEAELAEGWDLAEVRDRLGPRISRSLNTAAARFTRTGMTRWADLSGRGDDPLATPRPAGGAGSSVRGDDPPATPRPAGGAGSSGGGDDPPATPRPAGGGRIPERVELDPGVGEPVIGYPALSDEGATVGVIVADSPARQAVVHRLGLRRLVMLNVPDPTRWVIGHLTAADKVALGVSPYRSVSDLLADARLAAAGDLVDRLIGTAGPLSIRDEAAFTRLCEEVRAEHAATMQQVVRQAAEVLRADQAAASAIATVTDPAVRGDLTEQRRNLVFDGFLAAVRADRRADLVRYLKAIEQRVRGLVQNPGRDRDGHRVMADLEAEYAELCDLVPPGPLPTGVAEIGWLLEELRVSLFAQTLGTRQTVSAKRVRRAIAEERSRLVRPRS